MDFATIGDKVLGDASKALGNIEKAIIMIEPPPGGANGEIQNFPAVKPASQGFLQSHSKVPGTDNAGKGFLAGAGDALKNAGKALAGAAGSIVGVDTNAFKDKFGLPKDDKTPNVFYVQFNPSSVSFSATGVLPKKIERMIDTGKDGEPPRLANTKDFLDSNDVMINMSLDLIFEDIDVEDAFLENKLSPYSGELVQSVGKSITKMVGLAKTNHTVREQVEALTCIAREPSLGQVSFIWGKTSFKGTLNNLRAEYTMFSPKGEPIYAKAHVDILLLSGKGAMEEWDSIYEDAFGQGVGNLTAVEFGSSTSKVGSLLNISL